MAHQIDEVVASLLPSERALFVNSFIPPARPSYRRRMWKQEEAEGLTVAHRLAELGLLKYLGYVRLTAGVEGYGFEITPFGEVVHKAILEMWEAQEAIVHSGPPGAVGMMVANPRAIRALELKR